MAAVLTTADMTIQKNSKILVNVEEALEDLIVVSYTDVNKKFQGVLLDSNKGNLPFGVYSLHPSFTKQVEQADSKDEKLHSVSQRFTYQDPEYEDVQKSKKQGSKSKSQARQKMTVRLRPRKVLCSNCQGICNENSENVDVSKKRKHDLDDDSQRDSSESSKLEKKYLMGGMLMPKLSKLQPNDITTATKAKNTSKSSDKGRSLKRSHNDDGPTRELAFVSVSDNSDKEDVKDGENAFSNLFSNARTLKISFGEGEGTVVKIPPLAGDFNEDSGVSCDMAKPDSKAVKKALKKARKQAKKGNTLEKTVNLWIEKSPKHIGALSPRNSVCNSPPSLDSLEKKHKHKVKHKKKHKIQKKRDENTSKSDADSLDCFSNAQEECLKQKLSINLRRLSSNSYEHRTEENELSEDCESETVPDFPASIESVGGKLLRVSVGDIVWGKIVGFPWWPGKVMSVTPSSRAHVSWFASTTSSFMPCESLSPFLQDYKIRFNKKKRGPYKEAVKQATIEARRIESLNDPLASPTHMSDPAPHTIDVFS
ncbi:PWWP domain-containing protein 2A-like [Danaus plexippus]|uniref:PWWP domain-containing protein 2A-like n=1 Tax=Danaus plexippus TaxID=13037 RepID=UPI002AB2C9B1|nr:PWWP domain-containing protein 2A-like [Danaus plexippus]